MPFDVKRLDIYRKVPKDLTQPTSLGALISILSCIFIAFLFFSELFGFLRIDVVSELFVDDPKGGDSRVPVVLDVTFPFLKCEYLGLDIQDEMGRHEVGFVNADKKATDDEKGCNFRAKFTINKVPGNFHVSTHSAAQQPTEPDMRHEVNSLTFGDDVMVSSYRGSNAIITQHLHPPGSFNTLKQKKQLGSNPQSSHDYVLKVVPTIYENLSGKRWFSYQYTFATKEYLTYHHSGQAMPAVWFRYDLSPITVHYMERRQPIYSFLTSVCAIVGGTFTVAGIIDSLVFTASEFYKKFELGKLS